MIPKQALHRWLGPTLMTLVVLGALYLVTMVYATGETLLAGTILVTVALAIWVYTSERCYAYRYLFPGIAAALIFVIFPMVYTIAIGFTNYGSKNLLEFPRATRYLLEETYRIDGPVYKASIHPDGGQYRIRLEDEETGDAFLAGPVAVPVEAEALRATELKAVNAKESPFVPGDELPLQELIARQSALKKITVVMPSGAREVMTGLREFAPSQALYSANADGSLTNKETGKVIKPNFKTGFYETAEGDAVEPGFQVKVGLANFKRIMTDAGFRQPFLRIFLWTLTFSLLSVVFTLALGLVLAVLLSWDALKFRGGYRLLLFLPYAVPAFISILVWKGLFNSNTGEINLILHGLFGLRPAWFSDPFLARTVLLIVNTWLGFPYMMVVCTGLIKAIPDDLYEASAVAGAGPLTNFFRITVPLIRRPLTPLLISSFAFNFNNFVLISLLTGGRPDFLDTSVPAGTTDVLVSYTYRMAFQDHGQEFGLAAAISALIFLVVAVITFVQIRATKIVQDDKN